MEDITMERGKLKLLQKLMLHQMLTDMVGMEVMEDMGMGMEDTEEVMEDITMERGKLKLLQKLMLHQMLTDMVGMEVMEDMELTMGMAMEDTEVAMGDIIVVKERLRQMPTDMDMVTAMAMVMEDTG